MKHRIALVARSNRSGVGTYSMRLAIGENMTLLKLQGSIL